MKPLLKPFPGNRNRISSVDRHCRYPANGDFVTERYRLYHMAQQRANQSFETIPPSVSSQPTQPTQGPINCPSYHYRIMAPPYSCSGKQEPLTRSQQTGSQIETQSRDIRREPFTALTESFNEIENLLDKSDDISSNMKKEVKSLQMSIRSNSDTMAMKRKEVTEIMDKNVTKLREAVEKLSEKNCDSEDGIPEQPDLDLSQLRNRFESLKTTADKVMERLQRLKTMKKRRESPMSVLLKIEKLIDSDDLPH